MADVICPNCNGSYHETTDKYDPALPPNGTMFRLKDQYREFGWDSFIEDDSSIADNLFCPDCGGLYCENGKVRVSDDRVPCPHCGERFKLSGMHFHIKAKHSA